MRVYSPTVNDSLVPGLSALGVVGQVGSGFCQVTTTFFLPASTLASTVLVEGHLQAKL